MPANVVEDIWFWQIVDLVGGPDGDGGWELAPAEAIEEHVGGNVSAHGYSAKLRERVQETINVIQPWDPRRVEVELGDSFEEAAIGVTVPTRLDTLVEKLPSGVVARGVTRRILFEEEFGVPHRQPHFQASPNDT